ncbi:DUF2750 domain-containing protein [Thalassotalea atypica]|uniref:DUF2750 domain-containing protein n=1 Tax=Thalassotalea atypica TaxID=2054316 RepID=UPI0025729C8C|nr:DUF2750 domain-containing protein [Thalassotalea atypica]
MADELSQEKINQVLSFNDEQRAKYFFTEVTKNNEIWILSDEHGCVMLNSEDEDCVPVWPNQEFALAWANQEWQDCQAQAISINKWFSRWSHGLTDDELALVVFPSADEQGLIFYPDELEFELKQLIKKGRK